MDAAGEVTVGRSAYALSSSDPLNTLISVKRFMGRGIEDIKTLGSQLPYEMVVGDADWFLVVCPILKQ